MTKTTENNGTYTQLPIFQNLNPGECLLVKWFQEAPSWLAQNKKSLKFRVSRLLENDISEKCIIELKNSFHYKTQRYTWISSWKVISGLPFQNPGGICVFSVTLKNRGKICDNPNLWRICEKRQNPMSLQWIQESWQLCIHYLFVCWLFVQNNWCDKKGKTTSV